MDSEFSGVPASRDAQHCIEDGRRRFVMMYVDHLDLWADKKNGLKPSALAVYLCLLRHASWHTRQCFPSLDVIGDQTAQSRATVVAAIKALVKANLVAIRKEKVPGGYERSVYTILDPTPSGQFKNHTEEVKIYDAEFNFSQKPGSNFKPKQEPREQESIDEAKKSPRAGRDLADDERLVDVWAHECNGGTWPVEVGIARKHAKKLVTGGFNETEARELIAWLLTQEWRTSGITLGLMANQADAFRSAKREGKTARRKADKDGGMVWG